MPFSLVPFLLLVIPIIEIGAFIAIGGQIGIAPTLLMILVTAIIGSILLRVQGLSLVREIQQSVAEGQVPGRALGNGAMIVVAGILLLTPGFVTDSIGFLLFVPPVRSAIWSFLSSRITVAGPSVDPFSQRNPAARDEPFDQGAQTIDLDAEDYSAGPPNPNSPWHEDQNR